MIANTCISDMNEAKKRKAMNIEASLKRLFEFENKNGKRLSFCGRCKGLKEKSSEDEKLWEY